MNAHLAALRQRIGYRFNDDAVLTRALTHRSFGADHNERLEFLGDAVLSLAISALLFERFAGSDEGDLTRVRAHLVREESLHRVALLLSLPDVLRLGEGEARGGGAQRASILADALEALIGMRVLPTMNEYFTIQKAVNKIAQENLTTVGEIRKAFDKQKEVEYSIQTIGGKDLVITKDNDKVVISFAYDKEIELLKPVYLLIKYEGRSK